MSDPLSSAVLSLFQVRARTGARTAAQCPNPPNTANQTNFSGLFGCNFGNVSTGGMQTNSAGVSRRGRRG